MVRAVIADISMSDLSAAVLSVLTAGLPVPVVINVSLCTAVLWAVRQPP